MRGAIIQSFRRRLSSSSSSNWFLETLTNHWFIQSTNIIVFTMYQLWYWGPYINMTLSLPLRTEWSLWQCNICLGNTDKGQSTLPEWPQASVVKWIHVNMNSHILLGVCSLGDPNLGETLPLIFLRASRGHCMQSFHSPPALYIHWLSQPALGSVTGRQGRVTVSETPCGGGSTLTFSSIL